MTSVFLFAIIFLAGIENAIEPTHGTDTHAPTVSPRCENPVRIKEEVEWVHKHPKDPQGNKGDTPLPRLSPFHSDTEEAINKQINVELFAHYTYLSMAIHFDRDDINLPGFNKFFNESAEEEMEHARKFMKYQNKRGGRVKLHQVMAPCKDQWGNGLDAMKDALNLEITEYQYLLDLHNLAHENNDPQLQDFLESNYLGELVDSIKELSNYVNILSRLNQTNYVLGEYQFDKITLGGDKE